MASWLPRPLSDCKMHGRRLPVNLTALATLKAVSYEKNGTCSSLCHFRGIVADGSLANALCR